MSFLKKCLLSMLLACSAQVVLAEEVYADVESGLLSVHPAGSVTTVDKADAALAAVDQFTVSTEAHYIDVQRVCYEKFFVQHCLDKAKDDHRVTVKAINQVEIEANRFKRQARADDSVQRLKARNDNRAATKP